MKKTAFILIFLLILILYQPAIAQLGQDLVQLFMAEGDSAGSKLGYQVAGLGDQNGDGFDDILVGAPGDRKAFLYFGGNPMDTISDVVFQEEYEERFGAGLCNLGDVNGDSFIDFAIGSNELVRVYWGGAELDTLADWILPTGTCMCAAGDVNGDGYSDILISDVNWQSSQGRAFLYFGGTEPDSIPDWSAVGDSARYYFGASISGNGDINGDGYDDIAIGGWRSLKGATYPYIKIFYGGANLDTIPAFIIDTYEQPLDTGIETAFIDINGDHFADICIESMMDTSAQLFFGPVLPDIMPDLTLHGTYLSGKAWEISEAGDVNNDGYPDIIVGNYDGVGWLGEVLVFLGGPYMDGWYDIVIDGWMGPYKCAGRSVGRAGDVNGDGVDDILFGSWCDDNWNRQGRVVIFSGDTTLTSVSSDLPRANEPYSFLLKQNYPNPFNKSTLIEFQISTIHPARTVIKIYNILGEEVMTLLDALRVSGLYQVSWHGYDQNGTEVGSGIYFCQLRVGDLQKTIKLLLIR